MASSVGFCCSSSSSTFMSSQLFRHNNNVSLNSSVCGTCFPHTRIRVWLLPPQSSCYGGGDGAAAGKSTRGWQSRGGPPPPPAPSLAMEGHVSDVAGDALTSPRRIFLQSAALLAPMMLLDLSMNHAVASELEASESISKAADVTGIVKPSVTPSVSEVRKPIVQTESWYRFRGDGFAIKVPPEFEDIVEPDEGGTSLYGERAKEKPFAARFASPDRQEVLSVVIRQASQLRLSFFETKDISDFGSLKEVAAIFVPGTVLPSTPVIFISRDLHIWKYYLYEFVSKDKRVAMSAAAAAGRVYVVGAMAPQSRWKDVGITLQSAAASFSIL
ncbi:unnamed protein product [Sphagnum balticum]